MPSSLIAPLVGAVAGSFLSDDNGAEGANNAAAAATNQQSAIAQDQWDTYKELYKPLEQQYVTDAFKSDSPAAYERAAGEAGATVSEQFGKARERLNRTPGLDPSSAAYTSAIAGLDRNQAAVDAVSQNAARTGVRDKAWARKTDALSLGKGLPAQASVGLSNVASVNSRMAADGYARANSEGAAWGRIASRGLDAWQNRPGLTSSPPPMVIEQVSPGQLSTDFDFGYGG